MIPICKNDGEKLQLGVKRTEFHTIQHIDPKNNYTEVVPGGPVDYEVIEEFLWCPKCYSVLCIEGEAYNVVDKEDQ